MQPERPDRKVLSVWRWSNAIGYVIFGLIVAVGVFAATRVGASGWWWILVFGVVALYLFSALTLKLEWESWTYRLTPETLEMSHGWLFRQSRTVPRDRIQHLDVNSGPFDRRFGLVQVVVHTAGTTVGTIPGLSPERAERLRSEIFGTEA
ncbi:hypothetical protein EON82_21000 [bacterium]|nr:MAG: hypothetical protein EON82_21000 [bacterium]